jgi:hypothetical protein
LLQEQPRMGVEKVGINGKGFFALRHIRFKSIGRQSSQVRRALSHI